MDLKRITFEIVKTDDGRIVIRKESKVNQKLELLSPGVYKATLEKEDTELVLLKRYYFVMESKLAEHLGMKKTDLHEAAKSYVGQRIDETTGKVVYDSISKITDKDMMMARMYEFQQWAAKVFDYTFEPFDEEQ